MTVCFPTHREGAMDGAPCVSGGGRMIRRGLGVGDVEVEKRISPLRCSQNARSASVEMTIFGFGVRENRQQQGNGLMAG